MMGSGLAAGEHWFSTDRVLIYASFCADFGPMNLAHGRCSTCSCATPCVRHFGDPLSFVLSAGFPCLGVRRL